MPTGSRRPREEDEDVLSTSDAEEYGTPAKRARVDSDVSGDESDSDDASELSEHDREAEERATMLLTQQLQAKRADAPPINVAAEGGIILRIVCENFMCHDYLKVPLGPFMNFVCGHNGSGKSAVLTAITLCLGGGTRSTNRGSSLKDFVKTGEDTARISVTLKNAGDGFKPDIYGDEITVVRQFTTDGGSNYKLKAKSGKIVSSKKNDLDEIIDFYGLQVDNPMTILTQDNARSFLSTSTNVEKYEFFTKGVQLQQLNADYRLYTEAIESTRSQYKRKSIVHGKLVQEAHAKEAKIKQFDAHAETEKRFEHMQHQMAWIQVRDKENDLQECVNKLEGLKAQLAAGDEGKRRVEAAFEEANKMHDNAKVEVDEANAKLAPLNDTQTELKTKLTENATEISDWMAEDRQLKNRFKIIQTQEDKEKKELAEEHARLEQREGGTEGLAKQQNAAEERSKELVEEVNRLADESTKEDTEKRNLESSLQAIQRRIAGKMNEITTQEENIATMQRTKTDPLAGFDHRMRGLLSAIEKETRFREKPIGPLGRFIKLDDPDWLPVVQRKLQRLSGFLVSNKEDGRLLEQLSRRASCKIDYAVQAFKPITIQEPSPDLQTMLRILRIDDVRVRNYQIVNAGIEQAVLEKDLDKAQYFMRNRQRGSQDNVQACYALNPNRPGWAMQVGGPGGALGITPVQCWNGLPQVQLQDKEAQIDAAQKSLVFLQQELQQLEGEKRHLRTAMQQTDTRIRNLKSQRNEARIQRQRQLEEVDRLKAKIEEIAADGRIGVLQAKLEATKAEKAHLDTQAVESAQTRLGLDDTKRDLESKLKDIKQDIITAKRVVQEKETQQSQTADMRQMALKEKNDYFDHVGRLETDVEQATKEKEACKGLVEEYTGGALQVSDRVEIPEGENMESLDKKLTRIDKELKNAAERLGGTKEEFTESYNKTMQELVISKGEMQWMEELLQVENRMLKNRKRRWVQFQRYISARARSQFVAMMSGRGYNGRLRLEHSMKPPELIIEVQPGGAEAGNRGPKTLSGGEKSFSTICLLLALWEAMGSPIRALDEFDVFMDPVNRQMSVKMLIDTAERSTGKQFILITPQNMSQLGKNVKIFRMPDPDRGNCQRRIDE